MSKIINMVPDQAKNSIRLRVEMCEGNQRNKHVYLVFEGEDEGTQVASKLWFFFSY